MGKVQINAYMVNMAVRLIEMRRVLKPTGTIYLHCDPTASHYLKIVMDSIFGRTNFRNEIVWHYRRWTAGHKNFQRMHDVIFRYAKSSDCLFNVQYEPYGDWIKTDYRYVDEKTGKRWRWHTVKGNRYKVFLDDENKGVKLNDVWIMPYLSSTAKERMGYPTQKPLKLLERIIKASSNEGDLVFDPFCGCGTTVAAAEILKRQWIGIDITYSAIAAVKEQFKRQKLDIWGEIEIVGEPKTVQEVEKNLINKSSAIARKEFEKYCVGRIGGFPNDKMGADGGIDGRIPLPNKEMAIVSVKSGNVNVRQIRELKGLLGGKNQIGIFVTKEQPTKPMMEFANSSGIYKSTVGLPLARPVPLVQILTLDDILKGKQPELP